MPDLLHFLGVVCLLAAAALYLHYRWERRYVRRVAGAMLSELTDHSPRSVILAFAAHLHARIRSLDDDPVFLHALLGPLGATPRTILHQGGCCSGIARVLIVALNSVGVPAAQITLNHRRLHYRHCLVEARLNDNTAMLVDPKYGFCFVGEDRRPLSLEDLQAGLEPRFASLPGGQATSYPDHEIYEWDYRSTGTANWGMSRLRRAAYRLLHPITRGGIDRWRQPLVLEWPQLMLAGLMVGSAVTLIALALLLRAA